MGELDEILAGFEQKNSRLGGRSTIAIRSWGQLREAVAEIDTLLGSGGRPDQWSALQWQQRDEDDAQVAGELMDAALRVWPSVREALSAGLYGEFDPIPVDASDLGEVVSEHPIGSVSTRLKWSALCDEEFERLVYQLISEARGYDNVQWLQVTTRPDYRQHGRRERSEWQPSGCDPGSPWIADSLRFGNRLRRSVGCGSNLILSA